MEHNELKIKTINGIIYKLFEKVGSQVIGIIVTIILARLLEPESIGVVALASSFTLLFDVIATYGFGTYLIQIGREDEGVTSTAFYSMLITTVILYFIVFWCAPYIEAFYDYKKYNFTLLLRVLALNIIIAGLYSVISSIISKRLQFHFFFKASLIACLIGGFLGVTAAFANLGVWALVLYSLVVPGCNTLVLWFFIKWKPKRYFSLIDFKYMISYSWKIVVVGLLNAFYLQIRNLVIGKKYSVEQLAFYNKGFNFAKIIPLQLGATLTDVLFPIFSLDNDANNTANRLRRTFISSEYLIVPSMIGLFMMSDDLILVLLTDKWLEASVYLKLFCFSYIFYIIEPITDQAIKASGNSTILLHISLVKKAIGVLAIVITLGYGVTAIAFGYTVAAIICSFISSLIANKLYGYSLSRQIQDFIPIFFLCIVMAGGCYIVQLICLPSVFRLLLQIVSSVCIYIGLSKYFNFEAYIYFEKLLYSKIRKEKSN